jgi:hypothetical protein
MQVSLLLLLLLAPAANCVDWLSAPLVNGRAIAIAALGREFQWVGQSLGNFNGKRLGCCSACAAAATDGVGGSVLMATGLSLLASDGTVAGAKADGWLRRVGSGLVSAAAGDLLLAVLHHICMCG